MNNISQKPNFVGIDVSKKTLDVYIHPIKIHFKVSNNDEGFKKLTQKLTAYAPEQIVFEASGGYETRLLLALQSSGFNVWRVEPRRIKGFKQSEGIRVKTDLSDAKILALYAAEKKSKYPPRVIVKEELELQSLTRIRDDIKHQRAATKTRLQQEHSDFCISILEKELELFNQLINEIDKKITELIKNNQDWNEKAKIAQSMPGVGPVLLSKIIASLPELGNVSKKEIAALGGVAPYLNQSGNYKGRAFIQGGRADLRKDLYMAALSAAFHNDYLSSFYQKLRKAGKQGKVAIIAVARRMLVILNAMFRKQEMWKGA